MQPETKTELQLCKRNNHLSPGDADMLTDDHQPYLCKIILGLHIIFHAGGMRIHEVIPLAISLLLLIARSKRYCNALPPPSA